MTSLRTVFSRGAYRALGILAVSLAGERLGACGDAPAARAGSDGRAARSG